MDVTRVRALMCALLAVSCGLQEDPTSEPVEAEIPVEESVFDAPPLSFSPPPVDCSNKQGTLTCGADITASMINVGNDIAGSDWGVCTGLSYYPGNEDIYAFTCPQDGWTVIELTDQNCDADLMVLGPDCNTDTCVDFSAIGGTSDERVEFDCIAGQPYTIVVEGWNWGSCSLSFSQNASASARPFASDRRATRSSRPLPSPRGRTTSVSSGRPAASNSVSRPSRSRGAVYALRKFDLWTHRLAPPSLT